MAGLVFLLLALVTSTRVDAQQLRNSGWANGFWSYPENCSGSRCVYSAKWNYNSDDHTVTFSLSGRTGRWLGIGFSKDDLMNNTDVIYGWITPERRAKLFDGVLTGYSHPVIDNDQTDSIVPILAKEENGLQTIEFKKHMAATSSQDIGLINTYLVFPHQPSGFDDDTNRMSTVRGVGHLANPVVGVLLPGPLPAPPTTADDVTSPIYGGPVAANGNFECEGYWAYPENCLKVTSLSDARCASSPCCRYVARWRYDDRTQTVTFTISAERNKWVGIGFSKDKRMARTDVVYGWITDAGTVKLYDGYAARYGPPSREEGQTDSVMLLGASLDGDIQTIEFRKSILSYDGQDMDLMDTFLVFPHRPGGYNGERETIFIHERGINNPVVDDRFKVNFFPCFVQATASALTLPGAPQPITNEQGELIGQLSTNAYSVKGNVYIMDESRIRITGMNYAHRFAPLVYWYAGFYGDRSELSPSQISKSIVDGCAGYWGQQIYNENGNFDKIDYPYENENIILTIPPELVSLGYDTKRMQWLSLWCEDFLIDFGSVKKPSSSRPNDLVINAEQVFAPGQACNTGQFQCSNGNVCEVYERLTCC